MANLNIENIILGTPNVTGGLFVAPLKTPLPTDAKTVLNPAFKCVGYLSDDGVEEKSEAKSDSQKAWGGNVVKTFTSEVSVKYSFTLIEGLNEDALKVYYGDENVTVNNGKITVKLKPGVKLVKSMVIQLFDTNAESRIVIPKMQITDTGDIKYKDDDPISMQVTATALPDENGVYAYKYFDTTK